MSDVKHDDHPFRKFRSIGLLLLGASCLCGVIAYEKYRSAVVTTEAFSDAIGIEGVDFEASIPKESWVAGFFCVLLGVAALRCLGRWYRLTKNADIDGALLP